MHNSEKIKNTPMWSPRKTNETNCLKVKTWGGFDLIILKVKEIHYKRIEVFTKYLTLNILLHPVVTYWHNHVQASNLRTPSLLDLQNTNSYVCDFDIPLKSLVTQTLQFVTSRPPMKV